MSVIRFPTKHLLLGLSIRELIAPWTGHPYDFEIWTRLGYYMQTLSNPYRVLPYVPGLSFAPFERTGSISYPPFSAFIFAMIYRIYSLLGSPSRFLYYFLLKQPLVLADIGVAIVLARTIQLSGETRYARTAYLVWLYFPLGIIISTLWGQLDPVALLFSLLAVYYFLSSKWLPSAAMLGLAIYLKTLPVVFLPVFLLQAKTMRNKIRYSTVSLAVPVLGTLIPIFALNWGIQGAYNNFSFQAAIPRTGAMSLLGQIHVFPALSTLAQPITGIVWAPVLLATYVYIWKKNLALIQGLLVSILAFSMSRPFLPEQWSLYPLALLLLVGSRAYRDSFVGLAISATGFLVVNNNLLVKFFTPVSLAAFNWDLYAPYQPPFQLVRDLLIVMTSLLYFTESLLILLQRESLVHRAIVSILPSRLLQGPRVSPVEVRLA